MNAKPRFVVGYSTEDAGIRAVVPETSGLLTGLEDAKRPVRWPALRPSCGKEERDWLDRLILGLIVPILGVAQDNKTRCTADGAQVELSLPVERVVDGRYHLARSVGRGAMGAVFRATDLRLNRTVAVKIMMGALFGDGAYLRYGDGRGPYLEQRARDARRCPDTVPGARPPRSTPSSHSQAHSPRRDMRCTNS